MRTPAALALSILLALVPGCAPKSGSSGAPVTKASRSAPAPWSPVGAAIPGPDSPALPPLDGRKDGLDLERLARVFTTFTLDQMSLEGVASITAEQVPGLRSHLAASPKWRLSTWEGTEVAFRRESPIADVGRPVVGWGGYRQVDAEHVLRQGIRLGPWKEGAPEATSEMVVRVGASEKVLKLPAWSLQGPEHAGWQAVALSVQGPAIALEVQELSSKLELEGTIDVVGKTPPYLATASRMIRPAEVEAGKPVMLPRGEPMRGEPQVRVRVEDGYLDIAGRLNPGAEGWSWVRILSRQGEPWQERLVATLSMEVVGWTPDGIGLFYFQGQVPTTETPPAGGVVEAWFAPAEGAEPRLLGRWGLDPAS